MRELFTTADAARRGIGSAALRWGERTGRWRRIARGVYGEGPEEPSPLDVALALVVVTGGVASGCLAGVLHGLDGVDLAGPDVTVGASRRQRCVGVRRRDLAPERICTVQGFRCTDGFQTLIDSAARVDDLIWEQALESALRKGIVSIDELERALPAFRQSRTPGTPRMARVLALRPDGAPATGSLLETLMVQLVRDVQDLPDPIRQLEVRNVHDDFVAFVDLTWPDLGLFIELDGEHHKGQPVYDARRETAIVAATGWLCGRFTWTEVRRHPRATSRRLSALADQARRRPMAS